MKILISLTLLLCLLKTPSALAGEPTAPEEELPDMELLEFLGSFEDGDVGWIDPFEIPEGNGGARQDNTVEDKSDES